jgi:hypothetical protein
LTDRWIPIKAISRTATSDALPILTLKSPLVNMMGTVDTKSKGSSEAEAGVKAAHLNDLAKETVTQPTSFPSAFHDTGQSYSAIFVSLSRLRKNLI